MLYLYTIRLFDVHQPHHGLLAVLVIISIPSCQNESYHVGLQKPFAQDLIACVRDRNRLDKDVDRAYVQKLAPKQTTGLP